MSDAGADSVEAWLETRPSEGGGYGRLRCGTCVGEWHVEAYLGAGLSSEVYRVRNLRLSYEGALKLLVNDARNLKARFLAEIDALRFLSLSSLPRFFGSGEFGGSPYYVMEYLLPLPDPMPRGDVPGFMNKAAKAVQTLHEAGYVHRDLKPGNILLRRNGDPVLIDLGLVKQRGSAHTPLGWKPRRVSMVDGKPVGVGTLDFAAPEQLLEGKSLVQGDVFSLGKIAWYLYEENPPPAMRAIIHRATREIPTERYESAQAFATAVRRRNRRTGTLLSLAALGVVCLVLAVTFRTEIKRAAVSFLVPPEAPRAVTAPQAGPAAPEKPVAEAEPRPDAGGKAEGRIPPGRPVAETVRQRGESAKEEAPPVPEGPMAEILQRPDETDQAYFERLLPLAEKGNVRAQMVVAEACLYGRGTVTNGPVAVAWYRRAAEAGDASAQASLAYCLLNGLGCDRNYDEAVAWYAKAVEQNDLNALNGLAVCYFRGYGVKKDEKTGFRLAMKAAAYGHVPSQALVGDCYVKGLGVERDKDIGTSWLELAASRKNKSAQLLLLHMRQQER